MSKAPDGVSMCIFTPSIEGSLKAVNMMSTKGSTNSSNHCLTLVFLQNLAFSGSAVKAKFFTSKFHNHGPVCKIKL